MNMSEFLKGDSLYLSKDDVPAQGIDASIIGVKVDNVGDDRKPILGFGGGFLKPMVLNKTNTAILISLFGEDSNVWTGKMVQVYCDPSVSYAGKVTGGLRIRMAPLTVGTEGRPMPSVQPAAPQGHVRTHQPEVWYSDLSPAEQYEADQTASALSRSQDTPF